MYHMSFSLPVPCPISWILEENAFSAPMLFVFRGYFCVEVLEGFSRVCKGVLQDKRLMWFCFSPWAVFDFPDATSDDLALYQPFVSSLESSHHSTMLKLIRAYAHFV